MTLSIEYIPVSDLTPYDRNTRTHTDEDIDAIMESIRRTGFNDPCGIWGSQNLLVEGHGRLVAAKKLGMGTIPCIRLDHLTDEQRREYAILHNRTAELSSWDFDALELELADLTDSGVDLDFSGVADLLTEKPSHEENQESTQRRVANILNLENGLFPGEGPYDIPRLDPVTELPEVTEWIGFNYALTEKNPENKGVHFFVDDYQFQRVWNNPKQYIDLFRRFAVVATPDFSPYGDMPQALQIFNHYRKHWIGAFLQWNGVTVIPTIRCSSDERSMDWYLDGEPHGGIVLISNMWESREELKEIGEREYQHMMDVLNPCKVLIYGKDIPKFTEKRFKRG